jgi:hypothetical protein
VPYASFKMDKASNNARLQATTVAKIGAEMYVILCQPGWKGRNLEAFSLPHVSKLQDAG